MIQFLPLGEAYKEEDGAFTFQFSQFAFIV